MQALVMDQPGPPSQWRIANIDKPEPEAGEVRVRVHATGLNPADYKIAGGGHPAWQYPFVIGLDVAGTVDALGPEVTGWQIGDKVFYHGDFSRPGGYAKYTVTKAHVVAPIPEGVSFAEAATLPCAGLAAYQAIFRKLHLQAGQTILVQGGAGGVGGFAVQLAAYVGARVMATASRRNFDYVKNLGAETVIDYQTEDVKQRIFELTNGRGVEAIINTVSRVTTTTDLELLAFNGAIACVDSLPDFSHIRPFAKALSIHEIALGVAHLSGDRVAQEDLARMARELGALVAQGKISPMLTETIALEAVPEGLTRLAGRHVRGKIVAQIIAE
jgi:NADPH2:quinone reductase